MSGFFCIFLKILPWIFVHSLVYFIFIFKRDVGTFSVPVIAVAVGAVAAAAGSSDLSARRPAIVARELGNHLKNALLLAVVTPKDETIPFFFLRFPSLIIRSDGEIRNKNAVLRQFSEVRRNILKRGGRVTQHHLETTMRRRRKLKWKTKRSMSWFGLVKMSKVYSCYWLNWVISHLLASPATVEIILLSIFCNGPNPVRTNEGEWRERRNSLYIWHP